MNTQESRGQGMRLRGYDPTAWHPEAEQRSLQSGPYSLLKTLSSLLAA